MTSRVKLSSSLSGTGPVFQFVCLFFSYFFAALKEQRSLRYRSCRTISASALSNQPSTITSRCKPRSLCFNGKKRNRFSLFTSKKGREWFSTGFFSLQKKNMKRMRRRRRLMKLNCITDSDCDIDLITYKGSLGVQSPPSKPHHPFTSISFHLLLFSPFSHLSSICALLSRPGKLYPFILISGFQPGLFFLRERL